MQILTVAIQRGGTGKTTTSATLAQAAHRNGQRVLAIDLDPQGNLSYTLAADMNAGNSFELLNGAPARQQIQHTASGVDLIPAAWGLATITTSAGSAKRLQMALKPLKLLYDLIIIDCPPAAGELQYNALQASTGLIIPVCADALCLQGLYQITDTAAQIRKTNPALTFKGIIFTRHNGRSNLTKQLQTAITAQAAEMGIPLLGIIRNGIAIQEAQALQQDIYEYAPQSNPAKDYLEIYNKLMEG